MPTSDLRSRLDHATRDLDAPVAVVDLDAFDANADDLLRRASGVPVRVASKSLRCRALLRRVLARDGHTVFEASDAARALQLAGEHHPQLAILDLCLADGDGAALAGRLHAARPDLPLIAGDG